MNTLLQVSERSSQALFQSIWHAAVLLAVVAMALRLLPRLTAATRSLIWTAALLVVAALPFVPAHAAAAIGSRAEMIHLAPGWSLAVAGVWVALSLVRAGQLLLSGVRLRQIWQDAQPIAESEAFSVQTPLGWTREAKLCVSNEIARPSVIGFFHPRILVPADLYAQLSTAEIEQIVLHEMEHLRRGDDWRNLLQKIAVMLFPLNPALLWIERRLCFERELACDESVLAQTQAPKSYAACLVHLAEAHRFGRQISLALGAWERRSELGRRVHGILASPGRVVASPRLRLASAGVLTAGMVAMAGGLAHAPELVSFTAAGPASVAAVPVSAAIFHNASLRPSAAAARGFAAPHMVETMMRMPVAAKKSRVQPKPQPKPREQVQSRSVAVVRTRQAGQTRAVLTSVNMDRSQGASPATGQAMPAARAVQLGASEDSVAPVLAPMQRITFAIFEFSSFSSGPVPMGRLIIVQL